MLMKLTPRANLLRPPLQIHPIPNKSDPDSGIQSVSLI